ncbi:MAG: T9SS type A sorting domain-containing protein [Minisyncoccota bacterium]
MRIKKIQVLLLFLMISGIGKGQEVWKKQGIKVTPPVCYASPEVHKVYVAPPKVLKSGSLKHATIEVTYVGFPAQAQQAFQYAVDIWQNLIYSPVPVRVKVYWQSLAKGVLGSCGPANFYKNFNSTEIWNCYYPVALVEKMTGQDMSSTDEFDIIGSFNKDFTNWYFGTDGNTPTNQYDFASTVLHELTHGLGFSGYFYSSSGKGGYGSDGYAAVFDQFVENKNGEKLVDTTLFKNPSIALNQNLTSDWLQFYTTLANSAMPRLYAPAVWNDGSSIYHLDETTYMKDTVDWLMTPFSGMGEAIHAPGPAALAIMYEMGWKTTSIFHTPLKDIEFATTPIVFDAEILSDYGLDSSKVFLVYSRDGFVKSDSVLLKPTAVPDHFSAAVSLTQDGTVSYFFSATDVKNRRYVLPATFPEKPYSFKIGADTEPPVIVHEPIKYMVTSNLSAKIEAVITDNIGVKSARVQYFVNGGEIKEFPLVNDTLDHYSGELVFPAGSLNDGDQVSYRIVAADVSMAGNIGRSPESGYNIFPIEGIKNPVDRYVNNFDSVTNDFISSDFTVYAPSGFNSAALNSPHPYPSPETDNATFDFTAVLKYLLILKSGGKMSYDEIVLVEPADAGNNFGDSNFWDYVIVEGSKDGGNTWKPFLDGYDSNAQTSWLNLYNSQISGQNSVAVPTPDLFVNRSIDLLSNGNFAVGDTVQIRFRLFSDPYANGWGWIIDNLKIQDLGTAVNPVLVSSGEINFYPNPARTKLTLQVQSANRISNLVLKAYDSSGIEVFNQGYPVGNNEFKTDIDLSRFGPGVYLFALEPENGRPVTRKILVL